MIDDQTTSRIADRVLQDPKIQAIVKDARLFDSLRENEAWKRLYAMTTAKRARWMQSIMNRFMGPQTGWPKAEEIAYHQGFYQGAMYVLAHPEHAEASLERAATIAWAMTQEEAEEHA